MISQGAIQGFVGIQAGQEGTPTHIGKRAAMLTEQERLELVVKSERSLLIENARLRMVIEWTIARLRGNGFHDLADKVQAKMEP